MSDAMNFGKQAAGARGMRGLGETIGQGVNYLMGAGAKPAAKAAPQMTPPPVSAAPIKISPAEAAAGRAKITISPQDVAAQSIPAPVGRAGTAAPAWVRNNQAVARGIDPATGLKPGAKFAPPPAPTAAPIKISPAEAAAGRAKMVITPEEVAAVKSGAAGFGRKVANHVDFYERAPKDETKKKLPDHEIFNNALMRAEAAGEKPSAELFNSIDSEYKEKAKKEAKSKCVPCGSGMYKNYDRGVYQTGPMQAMDADEAISKANGGVESTEETEHAEKDIHNSGQKSAYAFGRKVAAFGAGTTPTVTHGPRAPVAGDPPGEMTLDQAVSAVNAPTGAPSPSSPAVNFGQQVSSLLGKAMSGANKTRLNVGDAIGQGVYNLSAAGPDIWTGGAKPGMTPSPITADEMATAYTALGKMNPSAPATSQRPLDSYTPADKSIGTQITDGLKGLSPGAIAGGGLGAAGLAALVYYLTNQKKKKKQDGEEG
jgi:hypothetical protein